MAEKLKLSDKKKKAILEAARNEFRDNGYRNTTMERIAVVAKVSKRTVYNHFPSKEDLFDAILESFKQSILSHSFPEYDSKKSLKSQLYNIINNEMQIFLSDEYLTLSRVLTAELIRTPERAYNYWYEIKKEKCEMFTWLDEAIADGRLKVKSKEFAVKQLGGMIKEFLFWPTLYGGQEPPPPEELDEIFNSIIDMFLGYYEVK